MESINPKHSHSQATHHGATSYPQRPLTHTLLNKEPPDDHTTQLTPGIKFV